MSRDGDKQNDEAEDEEQGRVWQLLYGELVPLMARFGTENAFG
jgi:hypothetical protein